MSLFPTFRKKIEDGIPLSIDQEDAIERAHARRRLNWMYDMIAQIFIIFTIFASIFLSYNVILDNKWRDNFLQMLIQNLPSLVIGAVVILKLRGKN